MNRRSRLLALLFGAERPFGAFGAPGDADCRWRMLRPARDDRSAPGCAEAAVPSAAGATDPASDGEFEGLEQTVRAGPRHAEAANAAEPFARETRRS